MSAENVLIQNGLIEIGGDGQPITPTLVLSSRGGNKIGVIQNVQNIEQTHPLSDVAELSFDVYKEANGITCDLWDSIKDFKFVQNVHDNTWYEMQVSLDDEDDVVKHVTCVHANEAELGQLNLYDVEINTEADIERDDYVETYFYNEQNEKASLLHRILHDKAQHYTIYHVDDTLKGLFRTFSFNGISVQEALNEIAEEVNCLFVYGEWNENDGKYHRTISAYDLEDYCHACGKRGTYTEHVCTNCGSSNIHYGYGEDTGIFVSRENLAKSISYEGNADEVKNCFRLVAGDDQMTAAIKSCNPSMSQYIWHFSDEFLEDMSSPLKQKIVQYQQLVESYRDTQNMGIAQSYITNYNTLVNKYDTYNQDLVTITYPILGTTKLIDAYYNAVNLYGWLKSELMPQSQTVTTTTADAQMNKLQSGSNMSEVGISSASGTIPYTMANSAIQSYARVYIDTSRYRVTVSTNSITNKVWSGTITLTAYADSEDTATSSFTITLFDSTDNTKYTKWVKQSVQKAMANREDTTIGVVDLFAPDESLNDFKDRIKQYSLDYLDIMSSMATSAITVMTEQGISKKTNVTADVYTNVYLPYYNKSKALKAEIATKETELSHLLRPIDENGRTNSKYPNLGLIDVIEKKQIEIRNALDIQTFLGDELWDELSFYRREDEYQNQNYISDGLSDREVIQQAQRFVEAAEKEIVKASTLQHTISAPLINFLVMPEFANLQRKFKVGNWIRLEVDGYVYKLRLSNWTIDYSSIEDLDIEFTDAIRVGNIVSDVASILSKSKSMSTSYDYTAKQANKGKDASNILKSYRNNGVDFKKVKVIKSSGNTNIIYDDDGILLKRIDGVEELPEQARIYNNGIYITDDNWETIRTGLGHFSYVDPETQQTVYTYGVIADTVIGKLILGNELKIYTQSGGFQIDGDGLTATNGTTSIKINPSATYPFAISKGNTNVLTVNSSGDLTVKGDIVANTLSTGGRTSSATGSNGIFIDANGNLYSGSSNKTIIYNNGNFSFGGTNGINFDGTNLTLGSNCSISWNNVTDQPSIPSDSHITQITKNTITTAYINALNIEAKSISADTISSYSGGFIISGTGAYSYSKDPSYTWTSGSTTYNYYTKATYDYGCINLGLHGSKNVNPYSSTYWTFMNGGVINMGKKSGDSYSGLFSINLTTGNANLYCNLTSIFDKAITANSTMTVEGLIKANGGVKGNLTGNVTGDVTGNVSGNVTGNVSGNVSGTLTGNVHGNVTKSNGNITIETTDSTGYVTLKTTKGAVYMSGTDHYFIPNDTNTLSLGSSGRLWSAVYVHNATISSSDIKNKDILGSIDFAEDLIMSLNPINFMWKDGDHRRTRMGFIAQDVAQVCKDLNKNLSLVTASYKTDKEVPTKEYFGEDVDDSQLTWGLSYEQLIAPMVAVIQNQERRIAKLESMIKE